LIQFTKKYVEIEAILLVEILYTVQKKKLKKNKLNIVKPLVSSLRLESKLCQVYRGRIYKKFLPDIPSFH